VRTAETTAPARRRPAFHPLRVAAVERLTADAVAVTFEVPEELAEVYAFKPGQSLTLRKEVEGADERRTYSICAPAGAAPRIGVREVPGGLFSSWLVHEVRPGDEIEVLTPQGSFTPDPSEPGHHLLIAAGSGITPMLSIAASVLANPDSRVTLLYGNRRTDTVMFAEELADLKDAHAARFSLAHVLSREPRDAELLSGRLDAGRLRTLLTQVVPLGDVDHVWLCGPFEMVTTAREVLLDLGVAKDRVHAELFFVEEEPPPPIVRHADDDGGIEGPAAEVTVILDGRETTLQMPREATVLDAAQKVRPDLPFACKGGVCGTCRARVTDGEVHMQRNFALEDREVEAGFVLTCQAICDTERVTVDFDA
jgi:ring-1,2-phenylacetyl-CoA epoxidase subunit PaaE